MFFAAALGLAAILLGPGRRPQLDVREDFVAVVYGSGNSIVFQSSADGGRSFREPVTVSEPSAKLHLSRRRGPRVALAGDTVVVTAIAGGELLSWRSLDDGRTWEGPARLNSVADSAREGLHSLAGHPGGTLFALWLDLRTGRTAVYGAVSRDAGRTWEERLVAEGPVCECCHPSALISGRALLHAMWRGSNDGARDMYYATSAGGWNPVKLGQGTWKLNACPMDGGDMAVDAQGQVHTIWRRESTIYTASPGAPERALGPGKDPALSFAPGGIHAAWIEGNRVVLQRPGAAQLETLAEAAQVPVLAGSFAAWEHDGNVYIQRLTGEPRLTAGERELEKAYQAHAAANAEATSAALEYERVRALVEKGDLPKNRLGQAEGERNAASERAEHARRRLADLQRTATPE
jgi:hypothetical protein